MKILVTGGAGYLGKRVVAQFLLRGHSVRVIARATSRLDNLPWAGDVEVHRADLRTSANLVEAFDGVDALVHLAASLTGDEDAQFVSTVVGTERLLEAMASSATRHLVLASSFSVYAWTKVTGTLDEASPVEQAPDLYSRDSYTIAKVWQERVARRLSAEHGWDLTVLRPGFIWGQGGEYFAALGYKLGPVYLAVGPRTRLPLTHVDNCADFFANATENPSAAGETFNVVDGDDVRVWQHLREHLTRSHAGGLPIPMPYRAARLIPALAAWINRRLFRNKGRLPNIAVPSRFEARFKPARFSNRKAQGVLDWAPPLGREECLRRTYNPPAVSMSEAPAAVAAQLPRVPRSEGSGSEKSTAPRATIIIPTFKRPLRLRECIASCFAQEGPIPGSFEILVVDNCPDGSAAAVVHELSRSAAVPVHYLHEPRPGISMARNAGLCHARGEFAVFIDDDEVATKGWLAHLLEAQFRSGADVVFGPVLPTMPEITDPAKRAFFRTAFSHWTDHPSGTSVGSTLLTPFWARGTDAYPSLATGNCLIRYRSSEIAAVRFDNRLGLFGGEDALYFNQLAASGAHFIWCAEAVAWEHVPQERLRLGYVLLRALRGGQVASWAPMLLSPARPALTALSMAIALVQAPVFAFLACGYAAFASPKRYYYLTRLAGAIGKLFWAAPFRRRSWPSWPSKR
ncbi:MAG: glycosyltransferase [Mesorhizobium sp.]|uniref:NAD-dependent epimerase/dehydratase family protein n=1 Tax=Mesorhizobium sp. TaxID=1871066 RepID=UPI000FE5BDB1|nr:NAD-dependent epimerase/dehydratase family protein [Mesorhizobium sp.]RWP38902.1 MAG: glycosyltransferase [Mesorhizobium sp.]